jgi:hypothetical protein
MDYLIRLIKADDFLFNYDEIRKFKRIFALYWDRISELKTHFWVLFFFFLDHFLRFITNFLRLGHFLKSIDHFLGSRSIFRFYSIYFGSRIGKNWIKMKTLKKTNLVATNNILWRFELQTPERRSNRTHSCNFTLFNLIINSSISNINYINHLVKLPMKHKRNL